MAACDITAERVRELLSYDLETGVFRWRVNVGRWGRIKAGSETGSPDLNGHLRIQIDGTLLYAHRVAWLHVTGSWPNGDIDHIDGEPGNNRWVNLRDVPHQINTENRRRAIRGKKSGLPIGVSIDARDGAYRADITVDGSTRSLGRHETPELAHAAYLDAKRILHAGCTI